ncbi:DNA-binding transcriptional regulator CsiR [compost metagenome]
MAVRHSVPLSTPEQLDAVERIIDEFEKVQDPLLSSQWNLSLHTALYAPAQMKHLENMITRAHTIAQRYTHIYMQLRSAGIDSQDEHRAILAAYRAKDVEAAVALMTTHLKQASDEAAEYLKDHFEV